MKSFRLTEEQLAAIHKRAASRGDVRTHSLDRSLPAGKSKYGNRKTVVDGARFDSGREAEKWQELRLREHAGQITGLERQVRFSLRVNGEEICCYIADFTYREDGRLVVADSKGVKTRDYIIKKKLMKAVHGIEVLET